MKERSHSTVTYVVPVTRNLGLSRHVAAIHEGKKAFKFDICEKSFARKGILNGHIATVHEKKNLSTAVFVIQALLQNTT